MPDKKPPNYRRTPSRMQGEPFAGDPHFGDVHRSDGPIPPPLDPPMCRTLDDMTPEEIAAIERQYNCRVKARGLETKESDHAPVCDPADAVPARGLPSLKERRRTTGAKQR